MKGRAEQDKKIKEYIDNFLKGKPDILEFYNISLYNATFGTKKIYITNVYKFLEFLNTKYNFNINDINEFNNIKLFHFNSYIEHIADCGDIYKATIVYSLKSFFNFLFDNNFITNNPTQKLKAPKDKKIHKIVSLDLDEIETVRLNILNGVGSDRQIKQQRKWINRDLAIVMLGLMNGLRISEILNIDIYDIDFDENKIKLIEKGNSEREICVSSGLMNIIMEWICDREKILNNKNTTNALFISNHKDRMSLGGARELIKKYTYNIKKNITPHKLRSTCATNLYNQTGDIYLTAHVLGHRNIQNTRRYANISEENIKKATNIMENLFM